MECDEEEGKGKWADQRFEGVCMNKPHKIRPLGDSKWCLTSGHEPRNEEQVKFQVSIDVWEMVALATGHEVPYQHGTCHLSKSVFFGRPILDVRGRPLSLLLK